jgi:hypothetical protein
MRERGGPQLVILSDNCSLQMPVDKSTAAFGRRHARKRRMYAMPYFQSRWLIRDPERVICMMLAKLAFRDS